MSKLLIKIDTNWADEFDVKSFIVMDEDEWNKLVKLGTEYLKNHNETIYFGSNEYFEIESAEEWLRDIETTPVTDDEVIMLKRMFGQNIDKWGWGTAPGYATWPKDLDADEG